MVAIAYVVMMIVAMITDIIMAVPTVMDSALHARSASGERRWTAPTQS